MNDPQPQQADVKTSKRLSRAWLLPLLAILIGGWILYQYYANQGALIHIEFPRATGLEAGKTKIRTRDLEVGMVQNISLKDDLNAVIVTVRMAPDTDRLLGSDSQFWIVTPRVSLSGIEGLGTILSGPYIEMSPASQPDDVSEFVALVEPPVTPPGTPGLHITLNSNDEFAFKKGDSIVYKGLKVGEFEDIYFNLEERIVYYNAFIQAPYHELITTNTKFWNVSGVHFDLGAAGVSIETASIESLLTNGATFGVPEGVPPGKQITERSFFDIYASYEEAVEERYKQGVEFIILVKDTIRGLQIGAPVDYRGIEIGKVVAIDPKAEQHIDFAEAERMLVEETYIVPVLISIQPGRMQMPDTEDATAFVDKIFSGWIKTGLRASLKTGSLLTGALYVELQHYDDLKPIEIEKFDGYKVIPSMGGDLAQLTDKVNNLLNTLNQLPLENMSTQINTTLENVSATVTSFQTTADSLNRIIKQLDNEGTTDNINQLLNDASQLLKDYSAGSTTNAEINKSLQSLQQTLNALHPLVQQLNTAPNSLIFNRGSSSEPEPKAKKND